VNAKNSLNQAVKQSIRQWIKVPGRSPRRRFAMHHNINADLFENASFAMLTTTHMSVACRFLSLVVFFGVACG